MSYLIRLCTLTLIVTSLIVIVACANTDSNDRALLGDASRVEGDAAAQFNNLFVLDNVWFAGQPTEDGLRWSKQQGVATVINIRTEAEMPQAAPYDEPALIEELGMEYVTIQVMPATFSQDDVEDFSIALAEARNRGGVLFHCGSSNRVGGLWAAYLHAKHNVDVDHAIELGKRAGLRKDSMIEATRRVMAEMDE